MTATSPRVVPDPGERAGWVLIGTVAGVSVAWGTAVGLVLYRLLVEWERRHG